MDKVAGLLFKISADTTQLQHAIKSTKKQLTGMQKAAKFAGQAFAAAFAARAILNKVKELTRIMAEFEKAMADVKAVTRASGDEFERLTKLAKDLGGTTKYTASEVAGLEKEYAKLGFTTEEIENAAEATLNLASAVDSELARAAEVMGGIVRSFMMDATEMNHVANVMAEAFSSTALDMEKFAEAMKYVGPIANAANISLEETTAMLGILANNMIDGSMAGTSLRMVISSLAKDSRPLKQRLEELSRAGLSLADAEDEVGRRAMTALLVLSSQVDMLPKLTEQYDNVGESAREMAETQLDTLIGQQAILKSQYEGLILEIGTTTDAMDNAKTAVGGLSTALGFVKDNLKIVSKSFGVMLRSVIPLISKLEALLGLFNALGGREEITETTETKIPVSGMGMKLFGGKGAVGKGRLFGGLKTAPPWASPDPSKIIKTSSNDLGIKFPEPNLVEELIKNAEAAQEAALAFEQLQNELYTFMDTEEYVADGTNELTEKFIENFTKIQERAAAMTSALQIGFQTLVMGFAEAFGNMVTGTGNFFQELLKLIMNVAKAIGTLMVSIGVAFTGSGIFAGFGVPMIAAGAGLIAASQIGSNLISRGEGYTAEPIVLTTKLSGRDIYLSNQRWGAMMEGST